MFITENQGIMGGVEDERGGASLSFEAPLDSTSAADTRWIKRFILYTVEMLFYECKWERTVSIILRFNALTRLGKLIYFMVRSSMIGRYDR